DFFTQTPRRWRVDGDRDLAEAEAGFGTARQSFDIGLSTAATPGVVRGMFAAHADLGRAPMRRIMQPAVSLARDGARLTAFEARLLRVVEPINRFSPGATQLFTREDGDLLRAGDPFRNP